MGLWCVSSTNGAVRPKCRDAQMEIFTRVFTPSKNRRLNELVGFLLFAAAVLLLLALIFYSPLDNSWNTAATSPDSSPARNWIGVVGAMARDLLLPGAGIT